MRRAVLAVLAVGGLLCGAGGCTSGDDPREQQLAQRTTTTQPLSEAEGTEMPPPLPGTPPEEIRAALDAAVEARDTCAMAAAIDQGIPDTADRAAVLEAYRTLLDSLGSARSFRPDELDETWDQLIEGVEAGLDALESAGGALDDPGVTATFTAESLQDAVRAVQRWADLNCGADAAAASGDAP